MAGSVCVMPHIGWSRIVWNATFFHSSKHDWQWQLNPTLLNFELHEEITSLIHAMFTMCAFLFGVHRCNAKKTQPFIPRKNKQTPKTFLITSSARHFPFMSTNITITEALVKTYCHYMLVKQHTHDSYISNLV